MCSSDLTTALPAWITAQIGSSGSGFGQAYIDFDVIGSITEERLFAIDVHSLANPSKKTTIVVKQVGDGIIRVTGLGITPQTYTFTAVGQTLQLVPTIHPVEATDKRITYQSNNTSVATVNTSGLVACVAPGAATITGTTVDGGFTATCVVSLAGATSYVFEAAPLSITHEYAAVSGGFAIEIISTLNGNPQGFTAVSSNPDWLQISVQPQNNRVVVYFDSSTPGVPRSGTVTITQNGSGNVLVANCQQLSQ